MTSKVAKADYIHRRGELLAQLFLEELQPQFLTQSTIDLGYDYLVGFLNMRGGINNIPVEIKATEKEIGDEYPILRTVYERLANSNTPVLLLVIDVKRNRIHFAWLGASPARDTEQTKLVRVRLTPINEATKPALVERLTA